MNKTKIEWTDFSTTPFKAKHRPFEGTECPRCKWPSRLAAKPFNFCVRISDGCSHCYAATMTHRWGGPDYAAGMLKCLEPVLVEKELQAILKFKGPAGTRIFPFDMTDIFLDFWPDEFRDKFFAVVRLRPDLTFQILTKRADLAFEHLSFTKGKDNVLVRQIHAAQAMEKPKGFTAPDSSDWPLPNVHLGVSVEDQKTADERIPWLLKAPAAKRFVSYEPALAAVDFAPWLPVKPFHFSDCCCLDCMERRAAQDYPSETRYLDQIIIGGESGPNACPFDIQWARDVIAQCKAADVKVFCKQLGSRPVRHVPNDLASPYRSLRLKDRKGGDMSEWPEDLRVRELPA